MQSYYYKWLGCECVQLIWCTKLSYTAHITEMIIPCLDEMAITRVLFHVRYAQWEAVTLKRKLFPLNG